MRFFIFLAGAAVLALGYTGTCLLDGNARIGFLIDALKLGGALVICGLFTLKMPRHGIVGAGVVALIGASFGAQHLIALPRWFVGTVPPNPVVPLSATAALICILLLGGVLRHLLLEKRRAQLTEDEPS